MKKGLFSLFVFSIFVCKLNAMEQSIDLTQDHVSDNEVAVTSSAQSKGVSEPVKLNEVDLIEKLSAQLADVQSSKLQALYAAVKKESEELETIKKDLKKIGKKKDKKDKDIIDKVNGWTSSVYSSASSTLDKTVKVTSFAFNLALMTWASLVYTRLTGITPLEAGVGVLRSGTGALSSLMHSFVFSKQSSGVVSNGANDVCAYLASQTGPFAEILKKQHGC